MKILFPGLRDETIIKDGKLRIVPELGFVGKFVFARILHEWMVGNELFYLKLALIFFGNLNPTCDFIIVQIDGDIIPEGNLFPGIVIEEVLKHVRKGFKI